MAKRVFVRRFSLCALAAFGLTLEGILTPAAHAGASTWTGGGASNAWSNPSNWTDGVPASNSDVFFTGSAAITQLTSLLDTAYTLNSLTFNAGSLAQAFTVTAGGANNILSIGAGGIVNNTALTQTIDAPVALTATTIFNAATAGGTLSFLGMSSNPNNAIATGANALTVTGLGNVTIASPLTSSGSGGMLTKTGNGTLTLNAANTFSGDTEIDGGVITVGNANALQNSTVIINDNNGLNLNALSKVTLGGLAGSGNLSLGGTQLTVGGNNATTTYSGLLSNTNTGFAFIKTGTGTLTLTGVGNSIAGYTYFNNGTTLIRGADSNSYASLSTGTLSSSYNTYIGYNSGDNGTVTVSGTNGSGTASTWNTNSNALYVGYNGTGTLNVTGGGLVSSEYPVNIGYNSGSNGTVTVSGTSSNGTASMWNAAGHPIAVGNNGTGTLNITGGGLVSCSAGSIVSGNGVGMVTVSGTSSNGVPSTWNISADLYVSTSGTGTLNVTGGALVSNRYGYIGYNGGFGNGNGTVMVSGTSSNGAPSTWSMSNALSLGTGTLNITGGGLVVSNNFAYIGLIRGFTSAVMVSGTSSNGTPSTWNAYGYSMYVGNDGPGTLTVTGGGLVSSDGLVATAGTAIGYGGNGAVTISGTSNSGTPSTWNLNNSSLNVGYINQGTLAIMGGAFVSSGNGNIGSVSGIVTVSGTSSMGIASTWNLNNNELDIGNQGTGALNISNGGKVLVGSGTTYLSKQSNSSSTLNINGGSLTTNILSGGTGATPVVNLTNPTAANGGGYALNLGNSNGSTTIGVSIGDAAGGAGGIDKTGTGTLSMISPNTFSGGLQIDGGSVVMYNANAIQNSTVIINIDNGLNLGGIATANLGGLAGSGALFLGSTAVSVGGNNASTTYSGVLGGTNPSATLTKTGTGTLTLTGASIYSSGTRIAGGKVVATGGTISGMSVTSGALGAGMVTVGSGATLAVGQAANTQIGTAVSGYQSLAISALTLTGNGMTGSATPLLTFDLGQTSSTDGSTNDFLQLAGSANALTFSGSGQFLVGFASGTGFAITGTHSYELLSFATPIPMSSATVSDPNNLLMAVATGNLSGMPNGSFSWATNSGAIVGLLFNLHGADAMPEPPAGWLILSCLAPTMMAIKCRRQRQEKLFPMPWR